jgi:hypothetical protein
MEIVGDWKLLRAGDPAKLSRLVQDAVRDGWQPWQGPGFDGRDGYFQAVVRYGASAAHVRALRMEGARELSRRLQKPLEGNAALAEIGLVLLEMEKENAED